MGTCWRNACCQRTHRGVILTSVKWCAPTSKTGSTAMGDLQCVFVHLCCRDLPTSTPFRSFLKHDLICSYLGLKQFPEWNNVISPCQPLIIAMVPDSWFRDWLLSPRQCLSPFVHGRKQKDAASAGPQKATILNPLNFRCNFIYFLGECKSMFK